jgi:uncharacterized protein (DUF1501 family)
MKRRDFIRNSTLAGLIPSIGTAMGVGISDNHIFNGILNTVDKANDHVLVLIQMVGGNDGLNMVLPMETYKHLWASRYDVVVKGERLLESKITDKITFHPAMEKVRDLYDENKIRIINSVGYPNQNFSHFRSMDIWMTGSDHNQNLGTGWLGRFLEKEYSGFPYNNTDYSIPPAIVTNGASPIVLQSEFNFGISISDPTFNYSLQKQNDAFLVKGNAQKELEFLNVLNQITNGYSTEVYKKAITVTSQKEYPNTNLGFQLKNIAKMIASGLKTKVYLATMTGFDTHANQVSRDNSSEGVHANLLRELSEGIYAFMQDLKYLGIENRVAGLTFSEFGRRVGSNGSLGTDHGAAAPMLAFGEQVLGGIAGDNPTIEPSSSNYTSLPMLYDFRSVFSSALKDWFCVKQNTLEEVFFKNYQYIPIFANFDCLGVTGNEEKGTSTPINNYKPEGNNSNIVKITDTEKSYTDNRLLHCYPNPFQDKLTTEFEIESGYTTLELYSSIGQRIAILANGKYIKGIYRASINTENLAMGIYFMRLQNNGVSKIHNLLKQR